VEPGPPARRPARRLTLLAAVTGLLGGVFLGGACGDRPDSASGPGSSDVYAPDGSPYFTPPDPARKLPNLVIVLIDTLRRDATVPSDGNPASAQMPKLAERAAASVSFTQAATPSPWTVPAVASMLTGQLPMDHGCLSPKAAPRLPESAVTYAEALYKAYGYETAAFTDAPWFRGTSQSILQGFKRGSLSLGYGQARDNPPESGYWLRGTPVVLKRWMGERRSDRPFFLLLHTFDAHDPYGEQNKLPRARWTPDDWAAFDRAVAGYDVSALTEPCQLAEVFMTDAIGREALLQRRRVAAYDALRDCQWTEFGKRPETVARLREAYEKGLGYVDTALHGALTWMREEGLLDNTLLVLLGDHGEAFAEHGTVGHGHHFHEELMRVPLVMSGPPPFDKPLEVDEPVGLIDVLPTFFDWAGLRQVPGAAGRSLLPVVRGKERGLPVAGENVLWASMSSPDTHRLQAAARTARWKYLIEFDVGQGTIVERLYDLRVDPDETQDLLAGRSIEDVALDADMCSAIARARARIWSEAESQDALHGTQYAGSSAGVTGPRPPPLDCETPGTNGKGN
jgi:arylsulfatase A-like enzyme